MADLGQGCTDHEPAERMGRCQTRCARGRGAMLDAWLPTGPERPLCTIRSVFLGCLEFLPEQGGGKEPAYASVATGFGRETGGGKRRLRLAGIREAHHPEDVGRGRTAKGYALSLSQPVQPPDPVDCGLAGAAEDRAAN